MAAEDEALLREHLRRAGVEEGLRLEHLARKLDEIANAPEAAEKYRQAAGLLARAAALGPIGQAADGAAKAANQLAGASAPECASKAIVHYRQAVAVFRRALAAAPAGHDDRPALEQHIAEVEVRSTYLEALGGAPATVAIGEHIKDLRLVPAAGTLGVGGVVGAGASAPPPPPELAHTEAGAAASAPPPPPELAPYAAAGAPEVAHLGASIAPPLGTLPPPPAATLPEAHFAAWAPPPNGFPGGGAAQLAGAQAAQALAPQSAHLSDFLQEAAHAATQARTLDGQRQISAAVDKIATGAAAGAAAGAAVGATASAVVGAAASAAAPALMEAVRAVAASAAQPGAAAAGSAGQVGAPAAQAQPKPDMMVQAVSMEKQALALELSGQTAAAVDKYVECLQVFAFVLKKESNENIKKMIRARMAELLDRAEPLKAQLQK